MWPPSRESEIPFPNRPAPVIDKPNPFRSARGRMHTTCLRAALGPTGGGAVRRCRKIATFSFLTFFFFSFAIATIVYFFVLLFKLALHLIFDILSFFVSYCDSLCLFCFMYPFSHVRASIVTQRPGGCPGPPPV